jgi:hypothetical protein
MTAEELEGHEYFKVPFSDNMKLAAGSDGTPLNFVSFTEDEKTSKIIVHAPSLGHRSHLQAFRVGGDSMEPIIAKNGLVIADKADTFANAPATAPRRIYVLCWDLFAGECAVKYLSWSNKERGDVLISSPAMEPYPPIVKNLKDLVVIGRVIWSWREHK